MNEKSSGNPKSSSPRPAVSVEGVLDQNRDRQSPIRLPAKQSRHFIASFNRLYQSLGMEIHSQMSVSSENLTQKKCLPCEGGVDPIVGDAIRPYMVAVEQWTLDETEKMISRRFNTKNFVRAIELINLIGQVAESEQHHPDLHLTGYRNLRVDLTTHAIGGLSENDFIVAAKIDQAISDWETS